MKIFYVEGQKTHREVTKHLLEHKKHSIMCYLPAESCYISTENPTFDNPKELTNLVNELSSDVVILDRETFTRKKYGDAFRDYLSPLLETYSGKIIVTTTTPEWDLQKDLCKQFPTHQERIRVFGKPFSIKDLSDNLK